MPRPLRNIAARLPSPDPGQADDSMTRPRALGSLFAAGSILGGLSLALPHGPDLNEAVLAVNVAVAGVVGLGLWLVRWPLPPWAEQALLAVGSVLIGVAVWFSGEGESSYAIFYIWVGIYAFYFLGAPVALLQTGWAGITYAAVLTLGPDAQDPAARWLITMGTVVVSGFVIAQLSGQVRRRAAEAEERAERQREAEARTRAIIETAHDAFVQIDDTGRILDWNRQAEATFGFSRREALGSPLFDLLVPERFRDDYEEVLKRFRETGSAPLLNRPLELLAVHRDGHEFLAEVTIAPLRAGDRYTFNAFARDITDRKRAERQVHEQLEDLSVVARVARDLASVTDAQAARAAICDAALDVSAAKVAILYEPAADGRELVSTSIVGARLPRIRLPFAGERSGAGVAFTSGQPFFVADLAGHPAVTQNIVLELEVRSALWQPVLRNGVSIGVLTAAWAERVDELSERVTSLMALLAAEAAVAIERADLLTRLEAVARTDDLTGLSNRRAWDEELPRELARSERDERPVCVAMLDLDRFKHYNDEHGHQAGDRLLKQLAAEWRDMLRPTDVMARYGGEEFVVLLPNCPLEEALDVVERLRETIPADQSCSAGIASWDGREAPESLVSRADGALYRAKREGRNRSVSAG
jgi:diguanylate cyclase (GGDEF)-like protein/PAS domain S-box-containing protein